MDEKVMAIAKLVHFGVEWTRDMSRTDDIGKAYREGSRDTVAHLVACWLCQNYSKSSEPTDDVADEMGLTTGRHPRTIKGWYKKLRVMVLHRKGA